MWSEERRRLIVEKLREQQGMAAEGLAEAMGVSRETVRRDLLALEASGVLRRVHGGAVLTAEMRAEPPMARRLQLHRAEKEAIARATVKLLRPGQTCFVDAGSTTALLAAELCRMEGLTILTNAPDVARTLHTAGARHEVMLLGGWLRPDIPGLVGETTMAEILRFTADVALVAPMALHPAEGATNHLVPEAEIARLMIRRSNRAIAMVVGAKLGQIGRAQICPCRDIHTLVTEAGTPADAAQWREAGIAELVFADR